jgi:hypothetical protein
LLDFAILAVGLDDADLFVDGAVGGWDFDGAKVHGEQYHDTGREKQGQTKTNIEINGYAVSRRFWAWGGDSSTESPKKPRFLNNG